MPFVLHHGAGRLPTRRRGVKVSGVDDFPQLTLSQVEDVSHLLEGLTAVPVINGLKLEEVEQFARALVTMTLIARDLENRGERTGFPMDEDAKRLGSAARIYVQGPGGAQVRLDVSKVIKLVEYEDDDQLLDIEDSIENGELDVYLEGLEWDAEAEIFDLNERRGNPDVEVTD